MSVPSKQEERRGIQKITLRKLQIKVEEDGGTVDLWNFDIVPQHYTASRPRRYGSV